MSFCASEEEVAGDDSMSLTASDGEEWVRSSEEPEAPSPSYSAWPCVHSELIRVLTRAVKELGLEWMDGVPQQTIAVIADPHTLKIISPLPAITNVSSPSLSGWLGKPLRVNLD